MIRLDLKFEGGENYVDIESDRQPRRERRTMDVSMGVKERNEQDTQATTWTQ